MKKPRGLPDSDFIRLGEPKKQCNAMVFGGSGEGKSTFALRYAPDPVALINFDNRADYAVRKAMDDGRDIFYTHVGVRRANPSKSDAQSAVDKVVRNFETAVKESLKGNIRTICLDTGTEYDEIVQIAVRGSAGKQAKDYGKSKFTINSEWWRLMNMAREGNAHFIVLSRAKEIWDSGEPTGRLTYRCNPIANEAVDWSGHIRTRTSGGKKKRKLKHEGFEMEITKAGISIDQLGEVYTDEEWDDLGGPFVYACLMQYSGTDVDDWV